MPFLELTLHCRDADQPRLEAALADIGALAVTLQDAAAETRDAQAILEPGVGETPLWPQLSLSALFPAEALPQRLLDAMEAFDPALELGSASFREIADRPWERAWLDDYQPLRFGSRLHVVPWHREPPTEANGADAVVVRLDPGLAFGSGTHPTTALCLEWLAGLDLEGARVLDFGCGSGLLAIAALKLGAGEAVGIDNDPQALTASIDNAERNGVGSRLRVFAPEQAPTANYPVVVANILAGALEALAPQLAAATAVGGRIALSGILAGQEQGVLERYRDRFEALTCTERDGWIRIDGVRRSD